MSRPDRTRQAQADPAAIDDDERDVAPAFARPTGLAALRAGRFLARHRLAGSATGFEDTRKRTIRGTPDLLIHRPIADSIQILRARHAAGDWRPAP